MNAQIGYALVNPMLAITLSEATRIAQMRAQVCAHNTPMPARMFAAASTSMIQPHAV